MEGDGAEGSSATGDGGARCCFTPGVDEMHVCIFESLHLKSS